MTRQEFTRGITLFFFPGVIIGSASLIGILSLFSPSFDLSQKLPRQRARALKENFGWPIVQLNAPETELVVHDYAKLKEYIDSLDHSKLLLPDSLKTDPYQKGVAFYFGRSDRKKNYVFIDPVLKDTAVMEPNNLIVVLNPVFYSNKAGLINDRRKYFTDPEGVELKLPFKYKKLGLVQSDIDSTKKFRTLGDDDDDNEPFDLGHTKP